MGISKNSKKPLIAVFDSGIGGLNLLKACVNKINGADFCYYADNFNVPYGNLCSDEIKERTFAIFDRIAQAEPVSTVVACNTVTACCIDDLRKRYPFPIAGVQPAVKQAAAIGGRYLVLATCATANSSSFKKLAACFGGDAVIAGCRNLANDIEQNIFALDKLNIREYLPEGEFASVVLGCTHYVFIGERLKMLYKCPVFDGIAGTADHLLQISGIGDHQKSGTPEISFIGGDFNKNRAVFRHICR